jgi:hypothetical protein
MEYQFRKNKAQLQNITTKKKKKRFPLVLAPDLVFLSFQQN